MKKKKCLIIVVSLRQTKWPDLIFFVNNQYLIEFDGIQHFFATSDRFCSEEVEKIKQRDAYKNQWCKENNIPLIRIPYTHLKDLVIEDLLLETTSFLVK